MHLKRKIAPKNWPIHKKGTKYVVRPSSSLGSGVPLLIILRDILKVAQTRKEVKKIIHVKQVLLNNRPVVDEKINVALFDTLTIIPSKKYYVLSLSNSGKFETKEISEKDTNHKIAKIMDKKILKGKKVQLNLSDGRNFISDVKCNVNDSVLINLKGKKIEKCVPLKEKSKVFVFAGKHAGKEGLIKSIDEKNKVAEIYSENDKKTINVLIKQLIAIE